MAGSQSLPVSSWSWEQGAIEKYLASKRLQVIRKRPLSANSGQKQPGSSELKTGAIHLV